jgi:hypothetical protein
LIAWCAIKDGLHIIDRRAHILATGPEHERHEVAVAAEVTSVRPHEPIRTTATSS